MSRGGYQVPPAQTRPHSGREEGCDFGVFRGHSGSPEKPERGPGLWQCAHPCLWEPRGCRSREQNAQPSRVSERSGTLGQPLPLSLHFLMSVTIKEAAPSGPLYFSVLGRGHCFVV